jgi:AraC family transcriptional regulator
MINIIAMDAHFSRITDENKIELSRPAHTDMINYCELNEWYGTNSFRSFGIKYVIENFIYYKVDKKEHLLKTGDFMLACEKPYVKSYFESAKATRDLCININNETVKEVFTILLAKEDYRFDDYLAKYFKNPVFFESVCPVKSAPALNQKLQQLVADINAGTAHSTVHKEWFLDLAEKIIYHEYGNCLALNGIHSVKTETKKEILRRLKIARQYMDDCFPEINDIGEVAAACSLSEFHFFRSFKQAYSITPYQYLLQKRLEFAKSMLPVRDMTLSKIAAQCNFSDLPTFSKAFKKQFGVAPSQYS